MEISSRTPLETPKKDAQGIFAKQLLGFQPLSEKMLARQNGWFSSPFWRVKIKPYLSCHHPSLKVKTKLNPSPETLVNQSFKTIQFTLTLSEDDPALFMIPGDVTSSTRNQVMTMRFLAVGKGCVVMWSTLRHTKIEMMEKINILQQETHLDLYFRKVISYSKTLHPAAWISMIVYLRVSRYPNDTGWVSYCYVGRIAETK